MPGVTASGDDLAFCTAPWEDVFFKVHVLARAAKNDAPAIIAATFKLGPDGKPLKPSMTKGVELSDEDAWVDPRPGQTFTAFKREALPRPHTKHLVSVTAITMDFDEGSLFENQIREALEGLGIAGTFWQTWSSTVIKRRWRLALPLVRPYAYTKDGHEKVWSRVANLVLNQLRLVTLNPKLTTDWAMKTVVQPAILPCRPAPEDEAKASNLKNKPWGGVVPEVFHVDGQAIDPAEAAKAESSRHYANGLAFKNRTGRNWGGSQKGHDGHRAQPAKPYQGSPDAPGAAEAVAAWRVNERTAVDLTTGLDALQRLRRDGVGARKGGRGAALRAGCWHMHRCGFTSKEIQSWGMAALEATGGPAVDNTLIKDLDAQVRFFLRKEDAVQDWFGAAATALTVERIDPATGKSRGLDRLMLPQVHARTAAHFLRILAFADHLDTPEGGKLNFAVLSKVLGMPAEKDKASPAVIAWRHALIEAKLLSKAGQRQQTRYRRLGVA
jgi:hypothetical protein